MKIFTEEEEGNAIKDAPVRREKGSAEYRNEKRTEVKQRGLRAKNMKCGN
jgi:hypothetical protein